MKKQQQQKQQKTKQKTTTTKQLKNSVMDPSIHTMNIVHVMHTLYITTCLIHLHYINRLPHAA